MPFDPPDAVAVGPTDAHRLSASDRLIVTVLNDLLGATLAEMPERIDLALGMIGTSCGFDRTHVYLLHDDGAVIDIAHEWVAAGVDPVIDEIRGRPVEDAILWRRINTTAGPIMFDDVAALDPSEPIRAVLLGQGVASLLVVAIREGDRIIGMLGFDTVRACHPVTQDDLFLLEAVASALGALALRARAERATLAMQAALEVSRNQLQATLAALPDLVLEVDADGRFVAVHTVAHQNLAVPQDVILGLLLEDVLPASVARITREAMREVDSVGKSSGHVYPMTTPGGDRWFDLSAARRPAAEAGGGHAYLFVIRDITERTQTQTRLNYRETMLGGMFDLSPTGMILHDLATGRILEGNPAFLTAAARTLTDLAEIGLTDLVPPDQHQAIVDAKAALAVSGRYGPLETEYLRSDGTRFPVLARGFQIVDPDGRQLVWSVVEDLSAQYLQSRALEERTREALAAQARLETAIESLPDGFALFDADDRLVLSNRRYRQMFLPLTDMEGKTFEHLTREALAQGLYRSAIGREQAFLDWILGRHRSDYHETDIEMTDGRWLWSIEQATPDGGRVGLRVDVTAPRRAEQRLADVIEGAQVGTWEVDLVSGENHINDRWAEMLGYLREDYESAGMAGWQRLLHPDDLVQVDEIHGWIMSGEVDRFDYVVRLRHAEGRWVWVQSRGRVVRWRPDGQPLVMAGVHIDVSALIEAERRLAVIIDGAEVGTFQYDTGARVSRISDRWAAMLGHARQDLEPLTADAWRALVHPDDYAALLELEQEQYARRDWLIESELRLRHREGHWVWVLSRGQVVEWNPDGTPRVLVGVHLDITARKELEFALQREHAFLARLMETSVSGIIALDADSRIVFANKEAETILGRTLAEMEGQHIDEPQWLATDLDGKPLAQDDHPVARVLATGEVQRNRRICCTQGDGRRRILSINAAPLSAPGLAAKVVCAVTDITESVAAEAELRAAIDRAEAGNRAKSEFLANMSHEIRTPLNGVLGMAEVLGDTLRDDDQRAMLATIRESGELLLSIINDILDLAKIESGRLTLDAQVFGPLDLARRIETTHRVCAAGKGIALTVTADAGAALPRLGDAQRVMQILHNLVGNAVKFTETGGVEVRLSSRPGAPLTIEVRDTGIGMTDDQIARIFEDFSQADQSITRRFGGTGLGLPIVRRLVTLMGGSVRVTSEPGRGTSVRVILPLASPEPAAPDAPAQPPAAARPDLAHLRALVAEDNATNRLILRSMLTTLGLTFTIVEDGDEAVALWEPGRFDVLLLDISMPRKDGLSALEEIRRRAARLGVPMPPALAVTANAMTEHVATYDAAGFAACVAKPIRLEQLARALAAACDVTADATAG